jgi:hypothetical protein
MGLQVLGQQVFGNASSIAIRRRFVDADGKVHGGDEVIRTIAL